MIIHHMTALIAGQTLDKREVDQLHQNRIKNQWKDEVDE